MTDSSWAQRMAALMPRTTGDASSPDVLAILTALPPAQAEALITLGVGLAADAGGLWEDLASINEGNDARPAIERITHHALEAGLALTDQGNPT